MLPLAVKAPCSSARGLNKGKFALAVSLWFSVACQPVLARRSPSRNVGSLSEVGAPEATDEHGGGAAQQLRSGSASSSWSEESAPNMDQTPHTAAGGTSQETPTDGLLGDAPIALGDVQSARTEEAGDLAHEASNSEPHPAAPTQDGGLDGETHADTGPLTDSARPEANQPIPDVTARKASPLVDAPGGAGLTAAAKSPTPTNSSTQQVCFVSSNAPDAHAGAIEVLASSCLASEPDTAVVVLALQDYKGDIGPDVIRAQAKAKEGHRTFRLRHNHLLSLNIGTSRVCQKDKTGLMNMLAAKLGANCGAVALLIYTVDDVEVRQVSWHRSQTSETRTTRKGTVVMHAIINDREVVLASSHLEEGVRGKGKSKTCTQDPKMLDMEFRRVRGFRRGLFLINEMLQSSKQDPSTPGIIWGGDFNPRTQDSKTGCPVWPQQFPLVAELSDAQLLKKMDEALQPLLASRDSLGADPDNPSVMATFTRELEGTGITELSGLKCPTYKKAPKLFTNKDDPESFGFLCREGNGNAVLRYLYKRPAAWADRVFSTGSTDHASGRTPWLHCRDVQRMVHELDHDAVFTVCSIEAPVDLPL